MASAISNPRLQHLTSRLIYNSSRSQLLTISKASCLIFVLAVIPVLHQRRLWYAQVLVMDL